jgi:hypothetical protein
MTYETHGPGTSAVEVTNVSRHGLWLLLHEKEVFLPFEKFPWFRDAPIGKVLHVELPSAQHLYWPELDVDLEVESVLHPERYPLVSRVHEAGEGYAPRATGSGFVYSDLSGIVPSLRIKFAGRSTWRCRNW